MLPQKFSPATMFNVFVGPLAAAAVVVADECFELEQPTRAVAAISAVIPTRGP
jgi:hypothetical protein